ncbi:2-isopropylmalate synthase [Globomyces pollinis-pini]|nr:2-isopropylmalate synthase [Globomyces pollinis-pini]
MTKEQLIIFDTTLRDGEQSPGVTLTVDEKVDIARQLSRLGVDVCEAGFPIASPGDFKAVERIAKEVGPLTIGRKNKQPMTICGLARATRGDIQKAYDAIKGAPRHRIHTFLATSDIHLEFKLKISRDECLKKAVDAVTFARSLGCTDVEFSCEDACRSDREFLVKVLRAVVAAGATTLNIPDTVGYITPEEYGDLIQYLVSNVNGGPSIKFSTHCHNDLGLATANTLAGIRNGARQVEVTINGIGERAGNTALEEVVMAIHTHPNTFPVKHIIDTYQIYHTSHMVTRKSGMPIQPNKAIVGANAFAHESGIHQDGMLKNKTTYEIISPEILGLPSKALVLGKHSGRNAFKSHMDKLVKDTVYEDHISNDSKIYEQLFIEFKKLADSKKSGVTDQDLFALLDDHLNILASGDQAFEFVSLSIMSGSNMLSTATISIKVKDQLDVVVDAATGHGPVHAIFNAINRIVGCKNLLASYEVKAVTEGSDALGTVIVRIQQEKGKTSHVDKRPRLEEEDLESSTESDKNVFIGQGMDDDILIGSAKAYINAVNRMLNADRRYSRRHVNV